MDANLPETGVVKLKDVQSTADRRMIIPSVRIKWRQEGRYVYEPNEAAYSDFMVSA